MSKSTQMQALEACVDARIACMLVGPPGIGKTALITQMAREMGYTLITLIGSRMEATDLSGFPMKDFYMNDPQQPVTIYAPQHFQKMVMEKKKVIILLDEFSNTPPPTRASFLSFIQDRQFPNGEYFPKETIIIGAMNPMADAADGYDLDPATTNRMVFLPWKGDTKAWLEGMPLGWGREELTDGELAWRSTIVKYITDNPGRVQMPYDPDSNGSSYGVDTNNDSEAAIYQYAWASYRSWDNLSKVLGALPENANTYVEDAIIRGTVGAKVGVHFRDWLAQNSKLDVARIIAKPRAYKGWKKLDVNDSTIIARAAVQHLTVDNLDNILEIFEIFREIKRESVVMGALHDLAKQMNVVFKGNKGHEEARMKCMALVQKFSNVTMAHKEKKK